MPSPNHRKMERCTQNKCLTGATPYCYQINSSSLLQISQQVHGIQKKGSGISLSHLDHELYKYLARSMLNKCCSQYFDKIPCSYCRMTIYCKTLTTCAVEVARIQHECRSYQMHSNRRPSVSSSSSSLNYDFLIPSSIPSDLFGFLQILHCIKLNAAIHLRINLQVSKKSLHNSVNDRQCRFDYLKFLAYFTSSNALNSASELAAPTLPAFSSSLIHQ